MDKLQILGIGRDPVMLQKLLRFLNENPEWEATGTVNDESAITLFDQKKYDLIVLIDFLAEASVERFKKSFTASNPQVVFLTHYSDSTALLASELEEIFGQYPRLNRGKEMEEQF